MMIDTKRIDNIIADLDTLILYTKTTIARMENTLKQARELIDKCQNSQTN